MEGFVRQVMGWRDYIWHTYWHFGRDFRHANALAILVNNVHGKHI